MFSAIKNKVAFRLCIHLLVWLLLCIMPFMLSSPHEPAFRRMMQFSWIPMFFYAIVFYLNYFILTEKILFRKQTVIFIALNLLLILLCTWVIFESKELMDRVYHLERLKDNIVPPPRTLFLYKDALSMLIPIVAAIALRVTEKWTKSELEKKEAERESLNSELQHLKYQLQPHFFFNSLNNIYALIGRSPDIAQEAVHSLSQLMRYMLYETDVKSTSLAKEIDFMTQYINLMRLRVTDKTIVIVDFPNEVQNYKIPPLLFISLIENAFKHGISATHLSELFFSLKVNDSTIRFVAQNTNFPKTDRDKSGSGIGIENVRKRLELLYPEKYVFETRVRDSLYTVVLTIQLND